MTYSVAIIFKKHPFNSAKDEIDHVAVVAWSKQQKEQYSTNELLERWPPFAIFPVNGDQVRFAAARKAAAMLVDNL